MNVLNAELEFSSVLATVESTEHCSVLLVKSFITLCRQLLEHLTAREIKLLQTHPITFVGANNKTLGGKTVTGPESDPVVTLFDAGFKGAIALQTFGGLAGTEQASASITAAVRHIFAS